ncbi:MAG: hypothetical protein CMI18_06510 [Opitutaceae bacterium]|nr:hypothetical protein [Opitutaceae bacterium]|tara:strand:- start:259 stop:519 length:261 start_codon:yes stop_codon:yes gene_type:complete
MELRSLPNVKVELLKDTELICVFYRGKEIAHFHDHEEIDLRLSRAFTKKEQLKPETGSKYHHNRSKNSCSMQIKFLSKRTLNFFLS